MTFIRTHHKEKHIVQTNSDMFWPIDSLFKLTERSMFMVIKPSENRIWLWYSMKKWGG